MKETMNHNPNAVTFDSVYNPENDKNDDRAKARAVLIAAKHFRPDVFKTLRD